MALVACPECGKDVSSKATVCPNCGCPLDFGYGKSFASFNEEDWQRFERALEIENKQSKRYKIFAIFGVILITPIQWLLAFFSYFSGTIAYIISSIAFLFGALSIIMDGINSGGMIALAISFAFFVFPAIALKLTSWVFALRDKLLNYIKSA